ATLHVATDDPAAADRRASGPLVPPALLERLVATLGAGLRRARAHTAAHERTSSALELEARMIHAERLAGLGQIAAGIVHDLNTPLTTVVAYADYLRKKWADAPAIDGADKQRLV